MDRTNAYSIPSTPVPTDPKQHTAVPDISRKLSANLTENQNGATAQPQSCGIENASLPKQVCVICKYVFAHCCCV